MAALERAGVTAVTWNDSGYPSRLKEIADPPAVLFYKGTLLASDDRSVAIVGTRSPTTYGREAAAVLSRGLAQAGLTVVSGLALGIDGVAHRTALESGGRTIAVLAGGLDRVYPRDHTFLFQQIQEQGAVVSEQALGVRPDSRSFPRRNRLISGLSLGSVVIEAAEGSGGQTHGLPRLGARPGGVLRTGEYLLSGQRFHQPDDKGRRKTGDGSHRYIGRVEYRGRRPEA